MSPGRKGLQNFGRGLRSKSVSPAWNPGGGRGYSPLGRRNGPSNVHFHAWKEPYSVWTTGTVRPAASKCRQGPRLCQDACVDPRPLCPVGFARVREPESLDLCTGVVGADRPRHKDEGREGRRAGRLHDRKGRRGARVVSPKTNRQGDRDSTREGRRTGCVRGCVRAPYGDSRTNSYGRGDGGSG